MTSPLVPKHTDLSTVAQPSPPPISTPSEAVKPLGFFGTLSAKAAACASALNALCVRIFKGTPLSETALKTNKELDALQKNIDRVTNVVIGLNRQIENAAKEGKPVLLEQLYKDLNLQKKQLDIHRNEIREKLLGVVSSKVTPNIKLLINCNKKLNNVASKIDTIINKLGPEHKKLTSLEAQLDKLILKSAPAIGGAWISEEEIKKEITLIEIELRGISDDKVKNAPLTQQLQAKKEKLFNDLENLKNRFERDPVYREVKIAQNVALFNKAIEGKGFSPDTQEVFLKAIKSGNPQINNEIEVFLKRVQNKKDQPLSSVDMHHLSEALKLAKNGLNPTSPNFRKDLAGIKEAENHLQYMKEIHFNNLQANESVEARTFFPSLQGYVGLYFPLGIDTKLALLNALHLPNGAAFLNKFIADAKALQDGASSAVGQGNLYRPEVAVLFFTEFQQFVAQFVKELHSVQANEIISLERILFMKAGYLTNSQLITDSMELALHTPEQLANQPLEGLSKEARRFLGTRRDLQQEANKAKLSDGEQVLAENGYIKQAYPGVWGKTSWDQERVDGKLKLIWKGGFALPGKETPTLQQASFDFSGMGELTPDQEKQLLERLINFINSPNSQNRIQRDLEKEYGVDKAAAFVAEAKKFTGEAEKGMLQSFLALGTE